MATYQIPAQEPMCCIGEIANNWKIFRKAFKYYPTATKQEKEAPVQVATLKSVMGKEWNREAHKSEEIICPSVSRRRPVIQSLTVSWIQEPHAM